MASRSTNEEFAQTWVRYGGHVANISKALGSGERAVYRRRQRVEAALGIVLPAGNDATGRSQVALPKQGFRHIIKDKDCRIVVFGDAHWWPSDDRTASYLALLEVIKEFKPAHVIDNGDMFDGARISRHPPTGWANMPDVADELAVCQERKGEIAAVAKLANPACQLRHNFGNHDSRFSIRLAQFAPEFVRVDGTDLKDHFKEWSFAWSTMVNDNTMIKHRYKGGLHAAWSNTLSAGMNMVTNHLHRLCVTPLTDYNGRRWGIDAGTLSEFGPEHDKHVYAEDSPLNWGEGFTFLTFRNGQLCPPELVQVIDGKAWFRGQVIAQKPLKATAKASRRAAPALAR
jgi:hypothetical protein